MRLREVERMMLELVEFKELRECDRCHCNFVIISFEFSLGMDRLESVRFEIVGHVLMEVSIG
uniref:Uncharacterized protein n=1 Tax=Rhizophora mucronata TaxID=61149 RepID=A0A2P2PVZ8_RHIMU